MKRLGISVYPDIQSFETIKEYIKLASKYGFTRVFSSMWSVEGTAQEVLEYFEELIQVAHSYNMQVSLDVNPDCFAKIGASYDDLRVFNDLGVDILRMDICYGLEKDVQLVNNPYGIVIEFNASIMNDDYFKSMIARGANKDNIITGHNFYPQRYCGMKWNKFIDISGKLKKCGLQVTAFVTSHNKNACGVWDAKDGLCTVELMRQWSLDQQVRALVASKVVDTILIGNACASEEELKMASEAVKEIEPNQNDPVVKMMMHFGATRERFFPQYKIRVKPEKDISKEERKILFDFFPHSDVGDSSEWIWRSRMGRFLNEKIAYRKWEKASFDVGDVVIINENYQHYAGEVQIVLRPIVNDGTRNLIGHLQKEELEILNLIEEGAVVIFLEEES